MNYLDPSQNARLVWAVFSSLIEDLETEPIESVIGDELCET